ncbi:MAG: hypothetical protein OXH71_02715 [Candidatus Dadabacteria bacterium]|nr:hypothetical protein [Candidatus Dadabacteria bacterium]MDE0519591.1 hypothetical protein [Candidatus Dadabacteria bacterium]MDE0663693.1 hypothetical protein [Candidatus Dadabacteria bacterium]
MKIPKKTICIIADDMFFSSKIESAAKRLDVSMVKARNREEFQDKVEGKKVDLVIIDLASKRIDAEEIFIRLRNSAINKETFCIGYLPHVERDLAAKFREKGVDLVLPRSKFSQKMSTVIKEHLEPK